MMDIEDFEGITAGLHDAIAFAKGDLSRGRVVNIDVKAVRAVTKLTQDKFAEAYHLRPATVRDWEQGRRAPDTGSVTLLRMIEADPEGVKRILEKVDA